MIFTLALYRQIKQSQIRRKYLLPNALKLPTNKTDIKLDRTTMMLIVLLSIFLITELPQGKSSYGGKAKLLAARGRPKILQRAKILAAYKILKAIPLF